MEAPAAANLLAGAGREGADEEFHALLEGGKFRLERIVSHGQPTPEGQWYDQERPEWVLLAQGTARLVFEGGAAADLAEGDYLLIPAHTRHRVESVSSDAVWLALHFEG